LIVVRKGDNEIEGFSDVSIPTRLGPKRANKLRNLFGLTKADDIRKFVISRSFEKTTKAGKHVTVTKRPKIQRLVTPVTLHRKHQREKERVASLQRSKAAAQEYSALVLKRMAEQKAARRSEISKRRSSRRTSTKVEA
jgi:small subunit ribosomal protein S6e